MKTKINLTEKNRKRLQEALDKVQVRCKTRIATADDVYSMIAKMEQRLDIPRKHYAGLCVTLDPDAQDYPGAYKWIAESTHIKIVYTSAGVPQVVDISREASGRSKQKIVYFSKWLPEEFVEALVYRAITGNN